MKCYLVSPKSVEDVTTTILQSEGYPPVLPDQGFLNLGCIDKDFHLQLYSDHRIIIIIWINPDFLIIALDQ